ncbi:MAG: hypothetical protein JNM62_02220 [Flavobacteriales bacterium]|nr:hypothetical protein [Flavobacteriales bacterium]
MRNLNLFVTATLVSLPFVGWAQPRAAACFFSEDFESADVFATWDRGAQVEQRTPEGEGLGTFVEAWTLGNAGDANAAQYFPVVDMPVGNRFVMANDAAPPCNCAMDDVMLTTPAIDLTGHSGVALECRVFNEGTLGAGVARVEANVEGDTWVTVREIAAVEGEWQDVVVDLSTFDNSSALRLRFRWSDGGNWAGGFAVDDVCLRDRLVNDISVRRVLVGDATVSPFTTGDQSLHYRQLPLTQAGPLQVTAEVKNAGRDMLRSIRVNATVDLNGNGQGTFASAVLDSLLPGMTAYLPVATGWTPSEAGTVGIAVTATHDTSDDDASDNEGTAHLQLTAPGWDGGYSAMSRDDGVATASVGGTGTFLVANRVEITNTGDHANGISVSFDPALTQAGEVVRATLMDGNFSFVDTSMRRTLTQADIDGMWNGLPQYFSLSTTPALSPGDHWVAVQHLGTSAQNVHVNVGGEVPLGSSAILEGTGFTLRYLRTAPMVRLHLAEVAVGLADGATVGGALLTVYPVPANDNAQVVIPTDARGTLRWSVLDAAGRTVLNGTAAVAGATDRFGLSTAGLSNGTYTLLVLGDERRWQGRFAVAH